MIEDVRSKIKKDIAEQFTTINEDTADFLTNVAARWYHQGAIDALDGMKRTIEQKIIFSGGSADGNEKRRS